MKATRLEEHLECCKITVTAESLRAKWQLKADDLAKCRELVQKVAQAIVAQIREEES